MDTNINNTQRIPDSPSVQKYTRRVFYKKKLFILIVIIIVLIIPISILLLRSAPQQSNKKNNPKLPPANTATNMKIYSDNWNQYSIAVPQSWQVSRSIRKGTTGLNTLRPVTHQIEVTQFYLPGQLGVTIQISKGQPACPLDQTLTTKLAGLPSSYDSSQHTWTVPTTNEIIVVSVAFPGSAGYNQLLMRDVLPTKVPLVIVKKDAELLSNILDTLKFRELQPFHC